MRNKRVTASLCAGLLLVTAVGCGKSDEYIEVPKVEVIEVNNVTDTNAEGNNTENVENQQENTEENRKNQSDNTVEDGDSQQINIENLEQQPNAQLQSDFELDGDIESIGDNCVVINKVFHPLENLSVSYGDAEEKVLITVYFSEETQFEVWTIKNGGVNGDADIEKRQGTFSDLKQDTYVSMTGGYSGNDFHAKQVIIYYYI